MCFLDRLNNLDFYGAVNYQIDDGNDYECTHLRWHRMLRTICREASKNDSILDVGCGKGRMLWFFSKFDFCYVDGIENHPDMAAIAMDNAKKLKLNSRVFVMDAYDFTQWGDYNWFYIYNPFQDRVMEKCLQNMIETTRVHPRTLHVIYVNAVCHHKLLEYGFLEQPVRYSLLEKLWFTDMHVIRRYRYDP